MENNQKKEVNEALHAIARKAIALKSGARSLRSVMEQALIGIMYDIPSDPTITKVTVTAKTIEGQPPEIEQGVARVRYQDANSGEIG